MGTRPEQGKAVRSAIAGVTAIALLGSAATAGAATQLGETFAPSGSCQGGVVLQAASADSAYTVPSAGVITSWSFRAPAMQQPPSLRLKIGRPLGGNVFTIAGESGFETPVAGQLTSFSTQVPVQAGDVLGFFHGFGVSCDGPAGVSPFNVIQAIAGDQPPGSSGTYTPTGSVKLDLAAVLEPDCDNDGFGDETQDQDLNACPPPPDATITSGPKDRVKTKKKRAKATFSFAANEPAATFTCTLDGKQEFKACTSPLTVEVKKGEHTFSVIATDAGGNTGAAATDTWKVKRKKKRGRR